MVDGRVPGGGIPPLPSHRIFKFACFLLLPHTPPTPPTPHTHTPNHSTTTTTTLPCKLQKVALGYPLPPPCNLKGCMGVPLPPPYNLFRCQGLIIRAGAMPRVEVMIRASVMTRMDVIIQGRREYMMMVGASGDSL